MTPSRLLLIAQSPVLRHGIQFLVESSFPIGDVAEAENALDAYRLAPGFAPDLAIVQDALPGVTGMISSRLIRQISLATCVIVLADDVDLASRATGEPNQVDALLPTAIEPSDLADAIRACQRARANVAGGDVSALEIALLDGMTRGMAIDKIASATGEPLELLNAGLTSLLVRFDARDRASLIVNAIRAGWIDPHAQLPGTGPAISFAVAA